MPQKKAGVAEKPMSARQKKNRSKKLEGLFGKKKDVIGKLYPFYLSYIRSNLALFYDKYCDDFYDADEEKSEEHKLEWSLIHKEYEGILEKALKEFIRQEDLTQEEFDEELQDAADNEKNKTIINIIMAQNDYQQFVQVMKGEAKDRQTAQQNADNAGGDSKAAGGGKASKNASPRRRREGKASKRKGGAASPKRGGGKKSGK